MEKQKELEKRRGRMERKEKRKGEKIRRSVPRSGAVALALAWHCHSLAPATSALLLINNAP